MNEKPLNFHIILDKRCGNCIYNVEDFYCSRFNDFEIPDVWYYVCNDWEYDNE